MILCLKHLLTTMNNRMIKVLIIGIGNLYVMTLSNYNIVTLAQCTNALQYFVL